MQLQIETPRAFLPLLQPSRYKGAHGGRGSGKSYFFAELLVERCLMQKTHAVCIREIQKSLNQSVKKLIEEKIEVLGVAKYFEVQESLIKGRNGSLIIFQGMQNHTADTIKSLQGYDIAWVEEAQSLSARSLELLRPTIRKEGSEIWFSWNPDQPTDPIDEFLRCENPPPDAIVCEVNYMDNPWFPDVLKQEMEYDQQRDPDKYNHVWLGGYQNNSEARVFKNWKIKEFEAPIGTIFRLGADWGYANDPTVLVRCFLQGNALFIDYEAVMVGCEINNTPDLFRQVPESDKWFITADSARPETISYMRKHGYPKINPAEKGKGSIEDGIEFLKSFDIYVHPRCVNTIKELTLYSYKVDPLTGAIMPILEDKNNHCIPEGVLIETDSGLKPIELVTTNDRVMTRKGFKNVLWSGQTDIDRDYLRIETTNGVLYCTPDHKVYAGKKGFIRADALSYNDDVINLEISSWQQSKQQFIMDKPIDAIQKVNEEAIEFILKSLLQMEQYGFIDKFGLIILEKFQRAIMFTTKMAIRLTMTYPILNALVQKSILATDMNGMMIEEKNNQNISKTLGLKQTNGIRVKKEKKSLNKLAHLLIKNLCQLKKIAKTAALNFYQKKLVTWTCFVQTNANHQQEENLELMMKLEHANVEKNLKQINTRKSNIVPGHVLTITHAGMANKVYDLTIEDEHEFFANGVLVHNCMDALRYASEGIRKASKTKAVKPIVQPYRQYDRGIM